MVAQWCATMNWSMAMSDLIITHGVINVDKRGLLTSITIDSNTPERELARAVDQAEYFRRRWQATYPQDSIEVHRVTLLKHGWRFA